jgi:MFS family permease
MLSPAPLTGNRDFQRLWMAQIGSSFGARMSRTLFPALAVLLFAAEAWELTLLALLPLAAQSLTGLLCGGLADRGGRRRLMVLADLGRALLLVSVPLLLWWNSLTVPWLWGVTFGVAGLTALFSMADNGLLPSLVSAEDLPRANARLESTEALAEIGGPSAAGGLMALLGAAAALLIEVATYLWSALMLSRIRRGEAPVMQPETAEQAGDQPGGRLADLRTGVRLLLSDRRVAVLVLPGLIGCLGGGFFSVLYMPFVLRDLALDVTTSGIIIGLGGIGALLGAQVAGRLGGRLEAGDGSGLLIAAACIGFGGWLLVPAAALVPGWGRLLLLGGHQVISDAAMMVLGILAVSRRQQLLPVEALGRVQGVLLAGQGVVLVAGILLAGGLASLIGTPLALLAGLLTGLAVPLAFILLLPRGGTP